MKKRRGEPYAHLPESVIKSEAFQSLNAPAHVMLANAALRYRKDNNGDISLPQGNYEAYGLSGVSSVTRGIKQLVDRRLLIVTRRGGRGSARICNLYALAWRPIPALDKCTEIGGKARGADMSFQSWTKKPKSPEEE